MHRRTLKRRTRQFSNLKAGPAGISDELSSYSICATTGPALVAFASV